MARRKYLKPIPTETCPTCRQPKRNNEWYAERAHHMATSFAEGWTATQIGAAYGVSPEYTMKVIREEFGRERMAEVISDLMRSGLRMNLDDDEGEEDDGTGDTR